MCSYLQSAPLLVGQPVVGKIEKEEGYKQWSDSIKELIPSPKLFCHYIPQQPHTHEPPRSSTLATVFRALSAATCSQYCRDLHMTNIVSPIRIKVKKVVFLPPSLDRVGNRAKLSL